MSDIKVGDKLWSFEGARRVYAKNAQGRSVGGPIYREHFVEATITGETSRSWVVNGGSKNWGGFMVPKSKPFSTGKLYTAEMVDDACWVNEHRYRIIRLVEQIRAHDADKLRQIAEIVGYTPEEST